MTDADLQHWRERCEWREDMDGLYATACGEVWEFIDGGPAENKARFCPYCGGAIEAIAFIDTIEDDEEGRVSAMTESLDTARRRISLEICSWLSLSEYQRHYIDGKLSTYASLAVEAHEAQHQQHVIDQRVIGHGEGQEQTIEDVNAGRIDDLIQPRLRLAVEAEWERIRWVADALYFHIENSDSGASFTRDELIHMRLALLSPAKGAGAIR